VAGSSDTAKVILDLDNAEFVKKLKESIGLIGKLGEGDSVEGLSSALKTVGVVAGITAAAVLAVKSAIDLTEEAEHLKRVEQSFNAIAQSAGVSADVIKNQLMKAVGGLADDTDTLVSATKAMTVLGDNAGRMAEIMELARKTTKVFGGELLQNFESLSQALASGQTRALRQFGIIVDTDKAQKEYAKTLGISVNYLTDAGKKQAVLNAALEQGQQKFKGISTDTNNTTDSLTKINVALNQIKDTAVLAWDRLAGNKVRESVSAVSDAVTGLAKRFQATFGEGQEKEEARREVLEGEVKALEKQAQFYDRIKDSAQLTLTNQLLKAKQNELEKIDELEEQAMQRDLKKQAHEAPTAAVEEKPKVNLIDTEKLKEDRLKFEKQIEEIRLKRIESDIQYATDADAIETSFLEKQGTMEQEAETQKHLLKKQGLDQGLISQEQYNEAIINIDETLKNKLSNNNMELEQARLRALENVANQSKTVAQGMSAGWNVETQKAIQAASNFGNMGKVVFGAVKNNAVKAFEAIGDGSKNAGDAMKGFLFGAIADVAQAHGEVMLAEGIGTFNPIEIAQGGVLIALASAIRSAAGGKGSSFQGGGGGGGGGSAAVATQDQPQKPEAKETHKKAVTVNIQGSYYETEQTRTRLMDMIRESGDFTDFNLKQIGQP